MKLQAQVSIRVWFSADFVVLASGVVEIALAQLDYSSNTCSFCGRYGQLQRFRLKADEIIDVDVEGEGAETIFTFKGAPKVETPDTPGDLTEEAPTA